MPGTPITSTSPRWLLPAPPAPPHPRKTPCCHPATPSKAVHAPARLKRTAEALPTATKQQDSVLLDSLCPPTRPQPPQRTPWYPVIRCVGEQGWERQSVGGARLLTRQDVTGRTCRVLCMRGLAGQPACPLPTRLVPNDAVMLIQGTLPRHAACNTPISDAEAPTRAQGTHAWHTKHARPAAHTAYSMIEVWLHHGGGRGSRGCAGWPETCVHTPCCTPSHAPMREAHYPALLQSNHLCVCFHITSYSP